MIGTQEGSETSTSTKASGVLASYIACTVLEIITDSGLQEGIEYVLYTVSY